MVIKFLISSIAVVVVVWCTWWWGDRIAERRRLDRWVRSERTKRHAKNKSKRVQEAVDVLYSEISKKEEEQ